MGNLKNGCLGYWGCLIKAAAHLMVAGLRALFAGVHWASFMKISATAGLT